MIIIETLKEFLNEPKVKIYRDPDFGNEVFVEIGESGKALPISYYSDGFRNLLYLFIDMVWRASQLNPWLNYQELKKQTHGIVLIDEIDLHLHPKWQAEVLTLLGKLFPNVQFIITTHSPTVIANFKHRLDENEEPIDGLFISDAGKDKIELIDQKTFGKLSEAKLGRLHELLNQ